MVDAARYFHRIAAAFDLVDLFAFAPDGAEYAVVLEWIGNTFNAVLLLAFLTAAFHHAAAGLQVVIEDYVRSELKRFAAICAVNGLAVLLWLATTLSVLRIAL